MFLYWWKVISNLMVLGSLKNLRIKLKIHFVTCPQQTGTLARLPLLAQAESDLSSSLPCWLACALQMNNHFNIIFSETSWQ